MRRLLLQLWSWQRPTPIPDRVRLAAGLATRLAAALMLPLGALLSWSGVRHPGWLVLLVLVLLLESAAVATWWLHQHRIDHMHLVLTVPVGVAALAASAALVDARAGWTGYVLWTGIAFPYGVLLSLTFGYALTSTAPAVLLGAVWGLSELGASVWLTGHPLATSLVVLPPYLLYPAVGATGARLLARGAAELSAARDLAARQAAEIAAEQERGRHAQALHDRVLQTMETLARNRVIADAGLAERVADEAAWLRRFVETGELDHGDDLPSELAVAARAVAATGISVEMNDASLRIADPPSLGLRTRTALVEATHEVLAELSSTTRTAIVRAELSDDGVLVTILAAGGTLPRQTGDLDRVRAHLTDVGGRITIEPVPYAEIWVPIDASGRAATT